PDVCSSDLIPGRVPQQQGTHLLSQHTLGKTRIGGPHPKNLVETLLSGTDPATVHRGRTRVLHRAHLHHGCVSGNGDSDHGVSVQHRLHRTPGRAETVGVFESKHPVPTHLRTQHVPGAGIGAPLDKGGSFETVDQLRTFV